MKDELRIRNWVDTSRTHHISDHDEEVGQIGSVSIKGEINILRQGQGTMDGDRIENIRPIKLTEEWLLRFGWKKSDSNIDTWWKPEWVINKDQEGNFFVCKGKKVILKYVHKLQNLYFELEEEELIWK